MKKLLLALLFVLPLVAPPAWAGCGSLSLSAGEAVSNSLNDGKSTAWGVDQEICHGSWRADIGYLNEGHHDGTKRDGVFVMAEGTHDLSGRLSTEAFAGPYLAADTRNTVPGEYEDVYRLNVLAGLDARYQLDRHWDTRLRWLHVISFDNRDADAFLVSVGWTP